MRLGLACLLLCLYISTCDSRRPQRDGIPDDHQRALFRKYSHHSSHQKRSEKPNIVFIITDDQDSELGSMNFMPKTIEILRDGGSHFSNAFVSTPMCCPSRSSMLTGLYVHNHNVHTNNDNCSSIAWQRTHEIKNFGTFLTKAGYRTGYFGKYLNEYNGTYIPPGWSEWVGLIKNTRFYNYSINRNGRKIRHGDNYYMDYFTDLIANDSVTFLKKSKQYFPKRPVAMVLSLPAPHGPEDAAPQYQHMFQNITTHRTPSWNYAPNPDKQWLLQYTPKMEPIHIKFTDMLHRKRLQTLQSVDDAVEKVYNELKELGELDNTYIIYTSDHGYHLGQFGLVKGKAMPYDFDIRVPFYMRGPNVPAGVKIPNVIGNIDIAPTILDMAGVAVPEYMDGRSVLQLIEFANDPNNVQEGIARRKKAWRDTYLIERGKLTSRKIKERERNDAEMNDFSLKDKRLQLECQRPEYQEPCKGKQRWACRKDMYGNFRMYRCRHKQAANEVLKGNTRCYCTYRSKGGERLISKRHINSAKRAAQSVRRKFLRQRRSLLSRHKFRLERDISDYEGVDEANLIRHRRDIGLETEDVEPVDMFEWDNATEKNTVTTDTVASMPPVKTGKLCKVMSNSTVMCGQRLYYSADTWQLQKMQLDKLIKEYREKLEKLREIRRLLRTQKLPSIPLIPEPTETPEPTMPPMMTTAVPSGKNPGEMDMECHCEDVNGAPMPHIRKMKIEKRLERRERKKERRDRKRMKRRKERKMIKGSQDCDSPSMKCFTHDNQHWKTPPLWNVTALKRKSGTRWGRYKDPSCWGEGLECHLMKNDHWKVPPKWTHGPFCFCPNSNNNTYWCLRTINDHQNFLYCEFVTGFISYYDMVQDPYQLRNAVFDLDFSTLQHYHERLNKLRACKGSKECTVRTRPSDSDDFTSDSSGDTEESSPLPCEGFVPVDPVEDLQKKNFLALTRKFRLDYIFRIRQRC